MSDDELMTSRSIPCSEILSVKFVGEPKWGTRCHVGIIERLPKAINLLTVISRIRIRASSGCHLAKKRTLRS
jgi:hypothetical protein